MQVSDRQTSRPLSKPLPQPTRTSAPFWAALRQHRLEMQRCQRCERWVWYPRPHCPHCGGRALQWRPLSGDAVLHSLCISARPTAPEFADESPQMLALVELAEGPRLATTLVEDAAGDWKPGMRLRPWFDDREGVTLLRFRAAD